MAWGAGGSQLAVVTDRVDRRAPAERALAAARLLNPAAPPLPRTSSGFVDYSKPRARSTCVSHIAIA
jgi:hypothetical protein